MLNKLLQQLERYSMIESGDRVICAVSGGADSMAMLWSFYLLREKLGIELAAAHFNHGLRGEESDRDEVFVREFCDRYDIPLSVGRGTVKAGPKGLEAAAREARYAFFATLPGKIATAHTADDNAETVLMHLVRGTGLDGLGGIAPVSGNVIRPLLTVTRKEITAFLKEYHLSHMEDSSNGEDAFLRNRLRHHVMPLLKQENPRLARNLSEMAMGLRLDAAALNALDAGDLSVSRLRSLPEARQSRALARFLKENGVPEPERSHIRMAQALIFSDKPSAWAAFPGGVIIAREYDRLVRREKAEPISPMVLRPGDTVQLQRLRICYGPAEQICNTKEIFTVDATCAVVLRSRRAGDTIRLNAGTQTIKKLFIDRKIPAAVRETIPVFADEQGVLGVYGIGANVDRLATTLPAMQIRVEIVENRQEFDNGM